MYHTLETLTRETIENARGNEVSVKRADGAVFTVRHVDAMRYYVRDTREERAKGSGFALSLADIRDRINGA